MTRCGSSISSSAVWTSRHCTHRSTSVTNRLGTRSMLEGRVDETTFGPFLDEAFSTLLALVERLGAEPADVPGGLYLQEIGDDGEDVVAFVPIVAPVEVPSHVGVYLGELPATTVAVAVHLGGYDDVGETYRHLGRWVAVNATPRALPVRGRYLVGPPEPEDQYCTEIHWPVESTTPPTNHPETTTKEHLHDPLDRPRHLRLRQRHRAVEVLEPGH